MRRVPLEQVQCADNGKQYLLEHFRDRNLNVEACLYAYRRAFLNEHDLRFREGILHEDVEFTPRIMMQCGKVVELPDRLYHYLVRENSISTQKIKKRISGICFRRCGSRIRWRSTGAGTEKVDEECDS